MEMNYPTSWLNDQSIGERIACEVRLLIIKGDIEAGTVLSENHLAQEFSASRSPVRDALHVLESEGLIRLERMGAVVLGLSDEDVEELYDLRMLVETFVLKKLCKTDQTKLLSELKKVMDKMSLAMDHRDAVEFSYQDLYFHELIVKEANHARMLRLWNSIKPIVLTALLVATSKRFTNHFDEVQKLIDRHQLIIEAIKSKDKEVIDQTIADHFDDTRTTVSTSLKKNNKDYEST
jgi:GntR family transcriptional regulator of gluconate operon